MENKSPNFIKIFQDDEKTKLMVDLWASGFTIDDTVEALNKEGFTNESVKYIVTNIFHLLTSQQDMDYDNYV